jgi:hypothetical protein
MHVGNVQFIFAAIVVIGLSGCERDPTDQSIIANFQKHREDFEKLTEMVIHDMKLKRLDMTWSAPADPSTIGITPERVAEYRRIFRELGIRRGFSAYGDRSIIHFVAHAEGLSVAGHAKSYTWCDSTPEELVDSIDRFRIEKSEEYRQYLEHKTKSFQKHRNVFRHIEGNWYLEYDS